MAGATLALYQKDLGITHDAASAHGIPMPVLAHAEAYLQQALAEGLGAQDIAALRLRYPAGPR